MLNGLDPILIFQFFKLSDSEVESAINKIPLLASVKSLVEMPPIPVMLSERLTGIYIDSEDINIDMESDLIALTNGTNPKTYQRPMNSTVTINLVANKTSVGLTLLTALADLILPKAVSREYSISYFHGSIALFGGLLHTFSVNQKASSELFEVKLELVKTIKKTETTYTVKNSTIGTTTLGPSGG